MFIKIQFLLFFIIVNQILAQKSCQPQETLIDGLCYRFVDRLLNYNEAIDYCRSMSYSLASIHSQTANQWLQKQAASALAISEKLFWIGFHNASTNYTWTDHSIVNYINWRSNEPARVDYSCAVMAVADGYWQTRSCVGMPAPFLCAGPPGGFTTAITTAYPIVSTTEMFPRTTSNQQGNPCPRNWGHSPEMKKCYMLNSYVYNFDPKEYQNCNGTIRNDTERQYVNTFAQGFFASTGCFNNASLQYLIGTNVKLGNDYFWQDGEPFDYYLGDLSDWRHSSNLVVAVEKYPTANWTWTNDAISGFKILPYNCQYYLCKMDDNWA